MPYYDFMIEGHSYVSKVSEIQTESCHGAHTSADSTNPSLTIPRWAQEQQQPSPINPALFSQIAAAKPTDTVVL